MKVYRHDVALSGCRMNNGIRIKGQDKDSLWINHSGLAVVCEGGGQRGIFTAGILDTFLEHGFFPFKTLIGTSAGAQNLSAYACGAQGYARRIITHYTTHKQFFNPLRFARGGHLIDLDWLFETSERLDPLDLPRGQRRLAGRAMYLCASRSDTLAADYLLFTPEGWGLTVKASSAIPLFYRGGVTVDGVNYWDGGVADALPVQAAHDKGSDCIVVIRTLPAGTPTRPLVLPPSLLNGRLKGMANVLQSHYDSYRQAQAFIEKPPAGTKIIEMAPCHPLKSTLLGSRPEALKHDYEAGQACARQFMERYAWRLRKQPPR